MNIEIITSESGDEVIISDVPQHIITDADSGIVLEEVSTGDVLEAVTPGTLFDEAGPVSLVSTGIRFIQPTTVEEVMLVDKKTDFVGEDVIYKGEAAPGSLASDPVWRIKKIAIALDGDSSETWAGGSATFSNVWNDRATYTY